MTLGPGYFLVRGRFSSAFRSTSREAGEFQNPYGSGFNGELEVGWKSELIPQAETVRRLFSEWLKKIDHKHLGLDTPELGITTPETLLQACENHFSKAGFAPEIIRLKRGEDICYEFNRN